MADTVTKAQRSRIMAAVKSRDTQPEMLVRRLVHGLGFRFRLHRRDLPGAPDIVLPRLRKVIHVHGCFWHMHDCGRCKIPESRRKFWLAKLTRNQGRDLRTAKALSQLGWTAMTVWECDLRNPIVVTSRLKRFLSDQ
jgi:DNA mismatch endonuclease, patch repair protein